MSVAGLIQFDEGWSALKTGGIDKLEFFLDTGRVPEGSPVPVAGRPIRIFDADEMVYNMCTQKQPYNWSEKLYIRYGETLAHYLQQKVVPSVVGKTGSALLVELRKRWINHKIYVRWMDKFFQYLDRYYVKMRSAEPMNQRGMSIFKTLIFDQVSEEATKALLQLIESERQQFEVPEDVLRSVVEMYIELGTKGLMVYQKHFEEYLLPATSAYYAKLCREWLSEPGLDMPEYLVRAEKCLRDEDHRVARYLHQTTLPKLRGVTITQLLQEPQKTLMESRASGVSTLLSENRLSDLSRVYRLFSLVDNGLPSISNAFRQFVTTKGTLLVEARESQLKSMSRSEALNDPSFVQALIDLHDQYKQIVTECFKGDTSFQKSLKEAFEVFINKELSCDSSAAKLSIPALMSSFCDRLLKRNSASSVSSSGETTEVLISKLVDIFSFLSDKDEFAEIYRNQLSKRLLTSETSCDDSAERSLIQKLKMKCGANFTSKLEGMITDLAIANDMQREFRAATGGSLVSSSLDFTVTVLTTGFWPTYTPVDTVLTRDMNLGIDKFQDFYSKKTQHRRLQWIHSLGTVTMVGRFATTDESSGVKKSFIVDLVLNTYQALILLLFNDTNELSVELIAQQLKLDDGFTKKLLATMIFSKFKILNKSSSLTLSAEETAAGKSIESSDIISVNEGFSVPLRRVRIPHPTAGVDETHNKSKVEEDRSFSIEAALVRIMKARKVLSYAQLVAEVISQLSLFKPNPKAIKQRIDNLVEREFLEIDPENENMYKYLA